MSQIEHGVPTLNISTANTNCSLVPEELLEATLINLSSIMNIPVQYEE